jgi:hypothetical protein
MRGYFVSLVLLGSIVPSTSWARSNDIPTLDVRPVCRGIASQSGDPGLGVAGQTETFRQCMESEQAVLEQLRKEWSAFSEADKRHCVTLAKTGGESSNTELMTCLEMARDVRVLRSAAAAATSSGADDTKANSSPSTPAAQPAPGSAPQEPPPSKQPPKADGDSTTREVEQAKAEAQTAKESEALAQRKLADAEAALQRLKDEAARANADAERAKADAKAAKESEAAATRKFADAEAARVAAVKACHSETKSRPALERLRGLFRRGTKND